MTTEFPLNGRRRVLKAGGAVAALLGVPRWASAANPSRIVIGVVAPLTGPLAVFSAEMPFVIEQVKKATGGVIKTAGGASVPFDIVVKDSQSNRNRAAEVAQELILKQKVHLMLSFATPATVNPVADQCEINGVPCLTNDAPLQSYFFPRGGVPGKGFDWTYHFFWSATDYFSTYVSFWQKLRTNKTIGLLYANDDDGNVMSKASAAAVTPAGFKVVDPGRFDLPAANYNAQIAAFKSAGVEIVNGGIAPPEFVTFWNAAAQQGFKPKAVTVGKALELPAAVKPFGPRAVGLSVCNWWSPGFPFTSGLTGQTSPQLAAAYEAATGRQWSMSLGSRHALFELAIDVLRRTSNLGSPASIRDALAASQYKSIAGTIDFHAAPLPNCAKTPVTTAQWVAAPKGSKFEHDMVIVDNSMAPEVPVQTPPFAIT